MANKDVELNVQVNAQGSEKARKSIKDLAVGLNEAGNASNAYNKKEKALYQTGLANGKQMSKLRATIGSGSSGLVGAYATLAANVFAATAAFNALKSAAQINQVTQALEFMGNASGRNLGQISDKLQEITGYAISAEEALKTVSFASSAGLSTSQMEGLAKVAKGASLALGRDMGDAMDRLTRGAVKLEPEILDELGIIVRLDDATATYAATVGKSVSSLNSFERQQAFTNAIVEQGIIKYGALADAVPVNAFAKLGAALVNLKNDILTAVVGFQPLNSMLLTLADNSFALTGTLVLFASTISRQLIPSLYTGPVKAAEAAEAASIKAQGAMLAIASSGPITKANKNWRDFIGQVNAGNKDLSDADKEVVRLNRSIGQLGRSIESGKVGKTVLSPETIANMKVAQAQAIALRNEIVATIQGQGEAQLEAASKVSKANALMQASSGSAIESLKQLKQNYRDNIAEMAASRGQTAETASSFTKMGAAAKTAGVGFRAAGAMFLRFLGIIGIIITVGSLLYELGKSIRDHFFPEDVVTKRTEKFKKALNEQLEGLKDVGAQFKQTYGEISAESTLSQRTASSVGAFRALAGVYTEFASLASSSWINLLVQQNKAVADAEAAINKLQEQKNRLEEERKGKPRDSDTKLALYSNPEMPTTYISEDDRSRAAINEATKGIAQNSEVIEDAKTEQVNVLKTLIEQETARLTAMGEVAGGVLESQAKIAVNSYNSILQGINSENAEEKFQEFYRLLLKNQLQAQAVVSVADNLGGALGQAAEEYTKLINKSTTPVDPLLKSLEDALKLYNDAKKSAADNAEALDAIKNKAAELGGTFNEVFKTQGIDGLEEFTNKLRAARDQYVSLEGAIKKSEANLKVLKDVSEYDTDGVLTQSIIDAENDVLRKKIEQKEALQGILQDQTEIASIADEIKGLESQIVEKIEAGKKVLLEGIKAREKQLEQDKARAALALENLNYETKLRELIKGSDLNLADKLNLVKQEFNIKRNLLLAEQEIAKDRLLIEQEITKLRFKGHENEAEILKKLDSLFSIQNSRLAENEKIARGQLDMAEKTANLSAISSFMPKREDSSAELTSPNFNPSSLIDPINAVIKSYAALIEHQQKVVQGYYDQAIAAAVTGDYEAARLADTAAKAAEATIEALKLAQAFDIVSTSIKAMSAQLASLGPDGELAANIGNLSASVLELGKAWKDNIEDLKGFKAAMKDSEGFTDTIKAMEQYGEGVAAALAAISSSIAAVGQVASAASDQRVAAIDKEIAAEQKRDGKSKESLAKIAQLEKKKEREKKKQFELNKKIQMAQIVINTAAGMMMAIAQLGTWGIPVAAVIGALGAAQLAIVAGTSYEGGASSAGAGMSSSVSQGERNNKVDVARQASGGELAYLSGERGMGTNANNFRPAFMGTRYRATGGYVVGEQGPELFVPDMPGKVVPNDEMAQGAQPINVTFSVQAIDAASFNDALTDQRGNIISMIREAANSYGQSFLENVNTDTLAAPQRTTYRKA